MRPTQAPFPQTRLRRTRRTAAIRELVAENDLSASDMIWPVFVRSGEGVAEPVPSMPGVVRRSVDMVVEAAREAHDLGIPAICLFPYTSAENRSEGCEEAWNPDNLSNRATRAIKRAVPDIAIMTDVALDPYSDTGHDGFVRGDEIVNDETHRGPGEAGAQPGGGRGGHHRPLGHDGRAHRRAARRVGECRP